VQAVSLKLIIVEINMCLSEVGPALEAVKPATLEGEVDLRAAAGITIPTKKTRLTMLLRLSLAKEVVHPHAVGRASTIGVRKEGRDETRTTGAPGADVVTAEMTTDAGSKCLH